MHARANTRQRKAHGAAAALILIAVTRVGRIRVGGQHDGLAHAIALQNRVAGARLPGAEGFDQHGGRARNKQAHMRRHLTVQPGVGQHAHIQRRHAHEDRGVLEARHHGLWVVFGKPDHGTAIEQCTMNRHKQTVHMEDRQSVNQHIAFLPAPVHLEHGRIGQQIAMAEHGPLAAPGGAAGVENGRQIVCTALHRLMIVRVVGGAVQQRSRAICAQRVDMAHAVVESNLGHPAKALGRTHDHSRLGIAHKVLNLSALVGGVEWQENMTSAQRGQIQHHGLDRLFHLHRNAAALGQIQ